MSNTITIERVDHIGIRVKDVDVAMKFYDVLGFKFMNKADGDAVTIIRTGKASRST